VQERPQLRIPFEHDVSTMPAVTAVRAAHRTVLISKKMRRAGSAGSRFTIDFNVINKV